MRAALIAAWLLAATEPATEQAPLAQAVAEAQQVFARTFANLRFEAFEPAPVKGPLYQAVAGGRIVYFAPESRHLLFAAVYDANGVNVTADAEAALLKRRLAEIETEKALPLGDAGPVVIEFTDPDCPYCRALERFWAAKQAEGRKARRLIFFVGGLHPESAAKAEHILCSSDPAAAMRAIYSGVTPGPLRTCAEGRARVSEHSAIARKVNVSGTPTMIVEGQLVEGFNQGALEAAIEAHEAKHGRR